MRKTFVFLALALVLLLGSAPVLAQGIPKLPHAFYGSVTVNGAPAADGTQVSATVDIGEIIATQNPVTTVGGKYGIGSPYLLVQGYDIPDGATITFHVTNQYGTATGGTATFEAGGGPTRRDLSVEIEVPPTPPTPEVGVPAPVITTVTISGLTATVPLRVNAQGVVQESTTLTTADGKLSLNIPAGTKILDAQGKPLTSLTAVIEPSPPSPPPGGAILLAYNLGPDGATFEPPITLTIEYDPEALPEGFAEEDLYIAYWDGSKWVALTTTVNTAANTVSCLVSHFTIFAIIGAPPPPVEYDLIISSTVGGSVTEPGEGTFTYDDGEVVNLVATPDAGYRFVNWTGDVDTIANVNAATTTITMNGDYSITANFAIPPIQYNLTISSTAGGSVTTPGEGVFTYAAGTVVNLVAQAEEGYEFVRWTGDVGTIANVNAATTTITMNGDYSITANFEAVPPFPWWWIVIGLVVAGLLVYFLWWRRR